MLERARDLILDPKRWTQGAYARDLNGGPIWIRYETAPCICQATARVIANLDRELEDFERDCLYRAAFEILNENGIDTLEDITVAVNDQLGHRLTIEMFDRAIKYYKESKCA